MSSYIVSDYETLLSRHVQVLVKNDAKSVENFKDAPIVVGEKVLRDVLNNKIVEGFSLKPTRPCIIITQTTDFAKHP